jgi:hypothetical protein
MANDDDKSSMVEIMMILGTMAPVLGAMVSAPLVGSTLVVLALLDSFLIGTGLM